MRRRTTGLIGVLMLLLLWMVSSAAAQDSNARVIEMWNFLNIRTAPTRSADVVAEVGERTPLTVLGRTSSNRWYRVQTPEGAEGWVAAGYVELLTVTRVGIPIVEPDTTSSNATSPEPPPADDSNSDIGVAPSLASEVVASGVNGAVNGAFLLNLRSAPTTSSSVLAELPSGTEINAVGRTDNSNWLRVETANGAVGWVASRYIDLYVAMSSLPVDQSSAATSAPTGNTSAGETGSDDNDVSVSLPDVAPPAGNAPYFTLGANSAAIFQQGQQMGNRANVFSKVGDSISSANVMYNPLGAGEPIWGDYGYLQPTAAYFRSSFTRDSLAAQPGWTAPILNNPQYANPSVCQPNESPLACEYRVNKPAVALIMLGTNDVNAVPSEEFAASLRVIVDYSIANGVVPVLSTIPPRRGFEGRTDFYNQLIVDIAREKGISLWDYGAVMRTLPDAGLSADGVHPSVPPDGYAGAANFRDNLKFGYVMRNLTALQVLDVLRRNALG